MQMAFNGLLRWVVHILITICVEFLQILGNFLLPKVLIAKQFVCYVAPYGYHLLPSWAHRPLPCLATLAMPIGSGILS